MAGKEGGGRGRRGPAGWRAGHYFVEEWIYEAVRAEHVRAGMTISEVVNARLAESLRRRPGMFKRRPSPV